MKNVIISNSLRWLFHYSIYATNSPKIEKYQMSFTTKKILNPHIWEPEAIESSFSYQSEGLVKPHFSFMVSLLTICKNSDTGRKHSLQQQNQQEVY